MQIVDTTTHIDPALLSISGAGRRSIYRAPSIRMNQFGSEVASSAHRQRSSGATPANTWSTWAPQPAQLAFLHVEHIVFLHMATSECNCTYIRNGSHGHI